MWPSAHACVTTGRPRRDAPHALSGAQAPSDDFDDFDDGAEMSGDPGAQLMGGPRGYSTICGCRLNRARDDDDGCVRRSGPPRAQSFAG